jgi:hypothetical protein
MVDVMVFVEVDMLAVWKVISQADEMVSLMAVWSVYEMVV